MAQKRKRNKKWISWVILLVLVIVTGVVVYLVWANYFNDKKEDNKGQETTQTDEKKDKGVDVMGSSEEVAEKEKIEQFDGDDPNKADSLSGVVTYAGVNDGVLMVRVNIDQYLEAGECNLVLSRGGSIIYDSIAEIVGGPSTASCAGFDVSVSGLGVGATEIKVGLKSGERSGIIYGETNI